MPSKSLRTDDLLEHILRLCVHHGSGRSPRALWVPRIQLKKHHPRQKIRAQTQEPILHNTCASPPFLPPAGFEGNLLQDGPRPRWREPPQAWWRRQISLFHQREREEGGGAGLAPSLLGGCPSLFAGRRGWYCPAHPARFTHHANWNT